MSLGVLIGAAEEAFRASEDGLTPGELGAVIGTRWPERVLDEMRRKGRVFGEEHGRLHLVSSPDVEGSGGGSDDGVSSVCSSLDRAPTAALGAGVDGDRSTELRLFEVEPGRTHHYDLDVAA